MLKAGMVAPAGAPSCSRGDSSSFEAPVRGLFFAMRAADDQRPSPASGRCASDASPAAALRFGGSSSDIISPLKKALHAAEQQRRDVAHARRRWRKAQLLLNPARLVFIDEAGSSTNMVRLRGRCPRGERLIGAVPHGHRRTITLVAGLRHDRIVAPFVIDGAMNGSTFRTYVERCLVRTLHRGDIVIIDNLPAHKVAGVTDAIEGRPHLSAAQLVFPTGAAA